jgi:aminocarboxymuconate-semialdehyde decarboxylase
MPQPRIDVHTHILPPHLPPWAQRHAPEHGFIQLDHHAPCRARMVTDDGRFFREVEHNCWDPEVRLRECEAMAVGVQVLSTVPVLFGYQRPAAVADDVARFLNDHLASVCQRFPRRFVGLGTLPLQDPDRAVRELERCVGELGLAGVQLGSHVNAWNLDEAPLLPVWQRAAELGAAVFVHPWDMMGQERMPRHWLPWLVGMPAEVSLAICSVLMGGILERWPQLRLCFAHGGGAFAGTVGRIDHGFQARPDLCATQVSHPPSHYLGRFWVDSLVHDARALRLVLETFGVDRVAVGSDYPFPLGEAMPGALVESLGLPPAQEQGILVDNALAWLGRGAMGLDLGA